MQANPIVIPDPVNRFWKFYPFIAKINALNTFSDCFMHQNFEYFKISKFLHNKMMVKVVKLFTGVLWKSYSDEFYRKTPMGSFLVLSLQVKEKLLRRCFPVSFTKYSRTLFLQNTFGWLLLLIRLFVRYVDLSHKCLLRPWLF